ncbi:hypothetical protein GQ472_06085 [archaeon]|nr:hypothetical protein [archaeon]
MELEIQVVSSEPSKRLKELEVSQDSLFWWVWETRSRIPKEKLIKVMSEIRFEEDKGTHEYRHKSSFGKEKICSAFSVAELGEMLPYLIEGAKDGDIWSLRIDKIGDEPEDKLDNVWVICYQNCITEQYLHTEYNEKLADAMALMLIHLIENRLIEVS